MASLLSERYNTVLILQIVQLWVEKPLYNSEVKALILVAFQPSKYMHMPLSKAL